MLKRLELTSIEHTVDRLLCSNLLEKIEWDEWHKTVFKQLNRFITDKDPAFSPRSDMEYDVCFQLDCNKFLARRFAECLKKICFKFSKNEQSIKTVIEYTFLDATTYDLDISETDQGKINLKLFLSKENATFNRISDTVSKAKESIQFSRKDFTARLKNSGGIIASSNDHRGRHVIGTNAHHDIRCVRRAVETAIKHESLVAIERKATQPNVKEAHVRACTDKLNFNTGSENRLKLHPNVVREMLPTHGAFPRATAEILGDKKHEIPVDKNRL